MPLTYDQHELLDSDQAAWFPVDAKNLVAIEERRFIRLYRRFKKYGRPMPLRTSYGGEEDVGMLVELPARFGQGRKRSYEFGYYKFKHNETDPCTVTRKDDALSRASERRVGLASPFFVVMGHEAHDVLASLSAEATSSNYCSTATRPHPCP